MSNKILVLGSTGKTGKRVYDRLQARGADVVPGSRSSATPFDWYNDTTWPAVLKGIDSTYITFQPDLAVPQSADIIRAFVEEAKVAGVDKLVLLSGRGETEAIACENLVVHSGLRYTIVTCSFFMQNFSEGIWLDGILSGEFVIPIVKAKEPFLDADDIADVVVEALIDDKHDGKKYELTGPDLLTFKEVIEKIAARSGRDIAFMQVTMEEYTEALRNLQIPDDYIWLIQYLFTEVLDGRNEAVTDDVEKLLGRKATSFDAFVEKARVNF